MTTRFRRDRSDRLVTDRPVTVITAGLLPATMLQWLPCLATGARDAQAPGRCVLCREPIRRGDRVADLADGTGTSHLPCIAASGSP